MEYPSAPLGFSRGADFIPENHRNNAPFAPPLGELAAKLTERVKYALSASGTSPKGRGKSLIRLALAGDA